MIHKTGTLRFENTPDWLFFFGHNLTDFFEMLILTFT